VCCTLFGFDYGLPVIQHKNEKCLSCVYPFLFHLILQHFSLYDFADTPTTHLITSLLSGPNSKHQLDDLWDQLTEKREGSPLELPLQGRFLHVPIHFRGLARFPFSSLCEQPLGPADYQLIAHTFHTLIIDDIPKMDITKSNEARRFITLVDELYNHKVKLICSAKTEPEGIFPVRLERGGGGSGEVMAGEEEVFAFNRVVSRLHEMQSKAYLESKHE